MRKLLGVYQVIMFWWFKNIKIIWPEEDGEMHGINIVTIFGIKFAWGKFVVIENDLGYYSFMYKHFHDEVWMNLKHTKGSGLLWFRGHSYSFNLDRITTSASS